MLNIKYKPVKEGGAVNHIQMLIICLVAFPLLVFALVIFGQQIDKFFDTWEGQFLAALFVCSFLGVSWFIWYLKRL